MSKKSKKHPKPNYAKQQRAEQQSKVAPATPVATPTPSKHRQSVTATESSTTVTLEPLAPLIIRSGRPFDAQAGVDTARFPPPSTVAGCLRTAWARANTVNLGPELNKITVAGPLLGRINENGGVATLLVPKPADAHYFGHDQEARCLRAVPARFDHGCGADLPDALLPVRLTETVQGKASRGPAWWDWDDLIKFRRGKPVDYKALNERGWSPPAGERRTHVGLDSRTLAADPGRLFQTEGLDFAPDNRQLTKPDRPNLRLLARCHEPLAEGLVHLGGERRLARLCPQPESAWPEPPDNWFEDIQQAGGLTLTLLTPGSFSGGYRPGWLDPSLDSDAPLVPGLRLELVAAAVERWQPHSGWDLARHEPRATRKLVPAGATYWLRLLDTPSTEVLATLWLASLCDLEQDRCDGYGLALPAPWAPLTNSANDL